jgi:hypothetical protein
VERELVGQNWMGVSGKVLRPMPLARFLFRKTLYLGSAFYLVDGFAHCHGFIPAIIYPLSDEKADNTRDY